MARDPGPVAMSSHAATAPERARLRQAIERVAHYLPAQAPLEVFVHHNTLHAFQHLPFHEAVARAQHKLGVRGYLPEEAYREALARGRLTEEDLDAVFAGEGLSQAPLAPKFPAIKTVARLLTRHGIGATTPADLHWQVVENEATTTFHAHVPANVRAAVVAATDAWLGKRLTRGELDVPELARLVVGQPPYRAPVAELEALLGAKVRPEAFAARREAVAVRALWTACVDACAHQDGLTPPEARPPEFHRELLLACSNEDTDDLVHPTLIPVCAAFLDRGQSQWTMPDREHGFFKAWLAVMLAGRSIRPGWLSRLGTCLHDWRARNLEAEDVVPLLLARIGVDPADHERFLERTVLQLPGWAGMFARLEHTPGPIGRSRARVALVDFLAVRLTLDMFAFQDVAARLGHRGDVADIPRFCADLPRIAPGRARGPHDTAWPLFHLAQFAGVAAPAIREARRDTIDTILAFLDRFDDDARLRMWHEAYEHHYRTQLLDAVAARVRSPVPPPPVQPPRYQVMFCIDDRFESSRRHLEELSRDVETFGAAGFFGLAIAYQGIDDPSTFPLCPVVVTPRHRIDEEPLTMQLNVAELRKARLREWGRATALFNRASRSPVLGIFVSILVGVLALAPLLLSVFAPRAAHRLRTALRKRFLPEPRTRLTPGRHGADDLPADQIHTGFSVEEKAARVAGLLENIGLTRRFARVVAVLGHDSASVNNPYFPAYACGACGGRSGGPNARLFARMANRPEVRLRLQGRGIPIPDTTWFVGGVYDTANDVVRFFDVESLPPAAQAELPALTEMLREMCRRNAHERCRRFASAPARQSPAEAHRHVERRAVDLSQARPELGHATNAACFVGRRALSQGLFLDRRAFLVSYDPTIDPTGEILERVLLAVGPVGAGINLEYYFSTVDAEHLGAGTKLPHNVTGLFGVMNGPASDLRTGLPRQMTEIHEPVRLHLVVEARVDTLLAIVERQPVLAELVKNEWVRVAAVDPTSRRIHTFDARTGFTAYHPSVPDIPTVARSVDWYAGHDGFLAPVRILPPNQPPPPQVPPGHVAA